MDVRSALVSPTSVTLGTIFDVLMLSSENVCNRESGVGRSLCAYVSKAISIIVIIFGSVASTIIGDIVTFFFVTAVQCTSLPAIANGNVAMVSLRVGSMAEYSCDPGFLLTGPQTRTCQSGGVWGGREPACTSECVHELSFCGIDCVNCCTNNYCGWLIAANTYPQAKCVCLPLQESSVVTQAGLSMAGQ